MKRKRLQGVVVALIMIGMVAAARVPFGVGAQEATPAAEAEGPPPGLAFETLAYLPIETLPSTPAVALFDRVTLEPGAVLPSDPGSQFLTLFFVEQGTVTIQPDSPIVITRAQALAAAMEAPGEIPATEQSTAGVDVTLGTGDSAVWPPLIGGEFRNDGSEPAVLLAVNIASADALQ